MPNCSNCPWNESYSNSSDICDSCQNDSDTGWGGFTDHRLGRHFYSNEERNDYCERYEAIYDDRTEDDL